VALAGVQLHSAILQAGYFERSDVIGRRAAAALKRLENPLDRKSFFWFVSFSVFVLLAFWPSYFSHPLTQPHWRLHTHGIAMSLWVVMLITQAYLIRTGRKSLHRSVGKASYVLVPLIFLATLNLVHFSLKGQSTGSVTLYFLALMLNGVFAFVLLFGLAMYHRRDSVSHARYMVCTIFPLFTPVTDRLIFAYFPDLIHRVPVLDGTPLVQVLGFLLADALVLTLIFWDRRAKRQTHAFAIALTVLMLYHASVLTFYKLSAWKSFAVWFASLPLS
jgi:hypothetical protein